MAIRKPQSLPGLLVLLLSLLSQSAAALSLGEIQLQSRLGEPLLATLRIGQAGDLSAEQLKIRLAPRQVQQHYEVTGYALQPRLEFAWQRQGDQFIVTISSREAIKEPFLHFMLQVLWPGGQLLKDCQLLLDPV